MSTDAESAGGRGSGDQRVRGSGGQGDREADCNSRALLEDFPRLRARLQELDRMELEAELAAEGSAGPAIAAALLAPEVLLKVQLGPLEGGFVRFPKAIPIADLTGGQTKILMYLYGLADSAGFCWPSQGAIAEATGLSRSGVQKALRGLVAAGWVQIVDRKDPVFGRVANGYQLRPLPAAAKSFETRDVSRPKRRRKTGGEPALFT